MPQQFLHGAGNRAMGVNRRRESLLAIEDPADFGHGGAPKSGFRAFCESISQAAGQVPNGVKASFDPMVMSDREKRLIGSNYGSSSPPLDFPRIIDLYMAGKVPLDALLSQHVKLEEINEAFEEMKRGELARSIIDYST